MVLVTDKNYAGKEREREKKRRERDFDRRINANTENGNLMILFHRQQFDSLIYELNAVYEVVRLIF